MTKIFKILEIRIAAEVLSTKITESVFISLEFVGENSTIIKQMKFKKSLVKWHRNKNLPKKFFRCACTQVEVFMFFDSTEKHISKVFQSPNALAYFENWVWGFKTVGKYANFQLGRKICRNFLSLTC